MSTSNFMKQFFYFVSPLKSTYVAWTKRIPFHLYVKNNNIMAHGRFKFLYVSYTKKKICSIFIFALLFKVGKIIILFFVVKISNAYNHDSSQFTTETWYRDIDEIEKLVTFFQRIAFLVHFTTISDFLVLYYG